MELQVHGNWNVYQQLTAPFSVTYINDHGNFSSNYSGQEVNFGQFVTHTIGNSFVVALREPGMSIKFNNLKLQGQIILRNKSIPASKRVTHVFVSGYERHVKGFLPIDVVDTKQTSAVAMEYQQGSFSFAIEQLTQIDISHVPCFGDARYSVFAYTNASDSLSPFRRDLFADTKLLRRRQQIKKGLIIEAILDLWRDVIFEIRKDYINNAIVLTPNHPDFQLHRLLDCLKNLQPVDRNSALTLGLLTEGGVIVEELILDASGLRMTLVHNMKDVCFYFRKLCFSKFQAHLKVLKGNRYRITLNGTIKIENTDFTTIRPVTDRIEAQGNSITRKELQNHFSADHNLLPHQLYDWISQDLRSVSFTHRPVEVPDVVNFTAAAKILQANRDIEVAIVRFNDRFYAAYGVRLLNQDLVDYLNAISSYRFGNVMVLKQTVQEILISISPAAIDNVHKMKHIPRGLQLNTTISIPQDCGNDRLCSLLRNHYPKDKFKLIATIVDISAYELTSLLPDRDITYLLHQRGVILTVAATRQIDPFYTVTATVTEMAFNDQIVFKGVYVLNQLSLTKPDRGTEVPRAGNFGAPLVASNMRGTAQISADGSIGQREYNATLAVKCTIPNCQQLCQVSTTWNGVVGVVPNTAPPNRYWYTVLPEKIQLACFLRAMGISYAMHWPYPTSYLLTNAFISYAERDGVTIIDQCKDYRDIPEGLHFSGKLNILCVDSDVRATSLPGTHNNVDIEVNLPYLDIGKKSFTFTMSANSTTITEGPYLRTVVGNPEPLQLQGYFRVLHMEQDGYISLSDDGFTLEIKDGFLVSRNGSKHKVYLCIRAKQDCILDAKYKASGYFIDLQNIVLQRVIEILRRFANETCRLDDVDFDTLINLSNDIATTNQNAQGFVRQAKGFYAKAQTICKLYKCIV